MATIGESFLDLIEIFKGKDKSGDVADIINMLAQTNAMLEDALTRTANQGNSHLSTFIAGIPTPDWGQLYKGIANKKITRKQIQDATGFIEARSTVDSRLADIEPNLAAFRLQEAQGIIEGMAQEAGRAVLYEDEASNPDRITGLAPRFNDLSATQGNQIIDAGGVGSDNTSIWFIQWGMDAVHWIYPDGSNAGIQRIDHGEQRVLDGSSNAFYAFEETFRWHLGVVVRDFRKVVRIANIDVSDLAAGTVDIYSFMVKALYQWHGARNQAQGTQGIGDTGDGNFKMGRGAIYCTKEVLEALDIAAVNQGASDNFTRLRPMEIQGREVLTYRGFPIRQMDQIVLNEARVT